MTNDLAARMRRLAVELSVGWEHEPHPDVQYLAYAAAFKEAARRIMVEIDHFERDTRAVGPAPGSPGPTLER